MKTALITGATSHLGHMIALSLAKRKLALILTGKSKEKLDLLKKEFEFWTEVETIPSDLANPVERKNLIHIIQLKTPELIINNAGLGLYGPALSHSVQEQMNILEVNSNALLEITLEGAKALIKQKKSGIILNVASMAGFFSFPLFSVYSASKAFVIKLSQSLDAELKGQNIRILCACPGQIQTGFRRKASKGFSQENSRLSMSVHFAAKKIIWQIDHKKPLLIFDWRYKLGLLLFSLIPRNFREKLFKKEISSRIKRI